MSIQLALHLTNVQGTRSSIVLSIDLGFNFDTHVLGDSIPIMSMCATMKEKPLWMINQKTWN